MKIAFFSTQKTDRKNFCEQSLPGVEWTFFEVHLMPKTKALVSGFDAVCVFVNDCLNREVLQAVKAANISLILFRCAGFNNLDVAAAKELGLTVLRVPAYSPMAVAEHALALMFALNRKTHKAYNRVREGNFSIEGLLGFDFYQKTAGVIGTGRIGLQLIRMLRGLNMRVLAYDIVPNAQAKEMGAEYVDLPTLYQQSDMISLHVPLTEETKYLIDAQALEQMKSGVMLINTSRGALIDTRAVIKAIKTRKVGYLGIDVYEQEESLFFEDHSEEIIEDDVFERLLTFPNVLVTAHQGFYTREAITHIRQTTFDNIAAFQQGQILTENCIVCPSSL